MLKSTALAMLAVAAIASAENRTWETGKVLDSKSSKSSFTAGATTYTNGNATATATSFGDTATATGQSQSTSNTVIYRMTIRDTELAIVGKDYGYIIEDSRVTSGPLLRRAIANHHHGCRFIVGDDVRYSQDKAKLYVMDADGKACKLDIVRQERLQR
jgi:hypothetical protein